MNRAKQKEAAQAAPPRGFEEAEFVRRTEMAQELMREEDLDCLLLTTEPEVRYFSGFLTQFWESPTRPWFLVIPKRGKPVAVIPEIGAAGMAATWIEEIRTWPAPQPKDDGLSILAKTLLEAVGSVGVIGLPLSHETHLHMPLGDFARLREKLGAVELADATCLIQALRMVKSEPEIDKIRHICMIASDAFEALPAKLSSGMSERAACKALTLDILARGADKVPYLIGASGQGGYDNIIMGPTDRIMGKGDVLIIDTGSTYDGYFCDFDRNFAFEAADEKVKAAYRTVFAATEAGFAAAKPGATCQDLAAAMWAVMEKGGALGGAINEVGRLGHGLGMQLTEVPSNRPGDMTHLVPGMVLTLEPGMLFAEGKLMVHEENIVIREEGAEWLSRRAAPELPVV